MIFSPKPGEGATGMHYVYDAWNRLAKVFEDTDDDGQYEPLTDEPVAAYEYDGANRRIEQLTDFVEGSPTVATHYFLSAQNQVLETREGSPAAAPESLGPKYQNVWSARYVDSLILRDEYSGGVLQPASRLFYLADANYNVTALVGKVSETWQVVERYLYAAYGRVTVLDPTFLPDANNASDFANTTLYTGRELDAATGLYYYRARYYDSELGRFVSRDPIGYRGSKWNLYEYVRSRPAIFVDPSGLCPYGACIGYPPETRPGGAGRPTFPTLEEYAFSQCKWDCLSLENIGNPLAPSVKVGKAANDCRNWGWEQAAKLEPDVSSAKSVSLRHCMAAACLARDVGCDCAQCLGQAREQYQYYEHLHAPGRPIGNTEDQSQRGIYRNLIGLQIVGCTGDTGDTDPVCTYHVVTVGGTVCEQKKSCRPSPTDQDIIDGCMRAWNDGRLDAFKPGLKFPDLDDHVPIWVK